MGVSLYTTLGLLLIALVVYDVYATILHARARSGPISESLNRAVWWAARRIANRLSRHRRHRWLNAIGPLLLPALIITFILLLVSGFALIYFPRMPGHFSVDQDVISSAWIESLYFSGITFTTLGYGDITPRSIEMRFVALVEGASGFAVISLAVTYLLTVYRALERKRAVALSFYHQAEEGANVAGFVTHHFVAGGFHGLRDVLRIASRDIQELLEAHVEHPVIHYFHPVEVHKGLPRMLFLVLEICTVLHACLDEDEYQQAHSHPEVRTLEASALYVLNSLVASLGLEQQAEERLETSVEEARRWRQRFKQTMDHLTEAGVKTRRDRKGSLEEYRSRRAAWEGQLHRFAIYLGYDWDEVTGDRDLQYASDEEMEEPQAINLEA